MSELDFTDEELEIARLAVEDQLIFLRGARLSVLRRNGLVVYESDGTPSAIVRLATEDAIRIGVEAIQRARGEK